MSGPSPTPATLPTITLVDDPHAPNMFASETCGFFMHNGVVTISFASVHVDHSKIPEPVNRVVTGRLVMPVSAIQGLAIGLFDFLERHGLDPAAAIKAGQTAQ